MAETVSELTDEQVRAELREDERVWWEGALQLAKAALRRLAAERIARREERAARDRLAAQLREAEAALATEREARNRIARENADRIGRAIDADKAAVVEFARAVLADPVLADRNWYCHDNGLDDAPIVREMAEQIEEGNSRGLIDLVMNALREAQAATRRECAEMVRRSIGPGDGAWVRRLDGLADRIERGPAPEQTEGK